VGAVPHKSHILYEKTETRAGAERNCIGPFIDTKRRTADLQTGSAALSVFRTAWGGSKAPQKPQKAAGTSAGMLRPSSCRAVEIFR